MLADLIVGAFAYYLPAYFAEASFQFVWGCLSREDIPVAARRLGPHRTFGGMFLAICCGGSVGFLVSSFTLGVFLGLGTWFGALGGSLIKRLLGIKRGDPALVLDQLDFILGATLLGCLVKSPKVEYFLIIACATLFIHRAGNILAYKVGIKHIPY